MILGNPASALEAAHANRDALRSLVPRPETLLVFIAQLELQQRAIAGSKEITAESKAALDAQIKNLKASIGDVRASWSLRQQQERAALLCQARVAP